MLDILGELLGRVLNDVLIVCLASKVASNDSLEYTEEDSGQDGSVGTCSTQILPEPHRNYK